MFFFENSNPVAVGRICSLLRNAAKSDLRFSTVSGKSGAAARNVLRLAQSRHSTVNQIV